ncbi:MAG: AAA family ATPase [Clostridia bacterium]|nr:AAA family ATPase [Clostridia bacterium]
MRIINITITEYASIRNRSFDFAPGLNIVEGENESGKSTILSFIKFILYGLPRRASGGVVTEKERSFSWDGGIAQGSMTLETEGGIYRVERSAREGIRGDKVSIIDTESGDIVHKGEVPGELFLGVPGAVFESTAFVRQLACGSLDGGELGGAIQNLLLSADETLDSEKAVTKIDGIRRRLLHKSGQGGSVYELTKKREEYAKKLEESKEKGSKIIEYEASFDSLDKLARETRLRLDETKRLLEAYDTRQLLIRFDSIRSAAARIESIESELDAIKGEGCYLGFMPDAAYQRSLAIAERDFVSAYAALSEKEKTAQDARNAVPSESGEIRLALDADAEGGASGVASSVNKKEKKAKGFRAAGIISSIAAIISAALTAPVLSLAVFDFPLLRGGLSEALNFLQNGITAAVFGVLFVLSLVFAVIFFVKASKNKKEALRIRKKYGIAPKASVRSMIMTLEGAERARERREALMFVSEKADESAELAKKNAEECRNALYELLLKVGRELSEDETPENVSSEVEKIISDSARLIEAVDKCNSDLAKYKAVMEEREKETSSLDEAELRRMITPEIEEKLSKVNITMLRREHEFLRSKLDAAEQKKYFYDRELIGLRATTENPLKSEALLKKTEIKLKREKELHAALTLASETIKEASEAMKRNVTPRLRASAGELMSRFTNGKYSDLGITPDFKITVNAGGITRPVEALSAGTRDAAYLSLRLALTDVLYRSETPPLLFDEVLSQIDNKRAKALLTMLSDVCLESRQCLLFSCHEREAEMIKANTIKL